MAAIAKDLVKKRTLWTRGWNIQGQLGRHNKWKNEEEFKPIEALSDQNITHLSCDHSQNLAVLNSQSVVFWGWPLCTRTTYKYLDVYERLPTLVRFWQTYTPMFRSGYPTPVIEVEFEEPVIEKIQLGWGYAAIIDDKHRLYMWGDNYAGQLGQGDDVHRDHPVLVKSLIDMKVVDISCGYQHSLILDSNGTVYGAGK